MRSDYVVNGTTEAQFDLSDYANGVYIVKVIGLSEQQVSRLIKDWLSSGYIKWKRRLNGRLFLFGIGNLRFQNETTRKLLDNFSKKSFSFQARSEVSYLSAIFWDFVQ